MKDLATLKKLIVQAKLFSEPLNYFFDLMQEQDKNELKAQRFITKPESHLVACLMLEGVQRHASQRLARPIQVIRPLFYEVLTANFCHGLCESIDPMTHFVVLYFGDIQLGIISFLDRGKTEIMRFSLAISSDLEQRH